MTKKEIAEMILQTAWEQFHELGISGVGCDDATKEDVQDTFDILEQTINKIED